MAATDARPVPLKNTAFRAYFPILDADGDLVSAAAALDSEVSIDGAAFADATSEATEIGTSGIYSLDLTAAEMNGDGIIVQVKTTTSGAKTTVLVFFPEETGDINVDITAFGGTAGTFAAGRPEVNTSHVAGTAQTAGDLKASLNTIDDFIDTEVATILAAVDTEVAAILALLDDPRGEPAQGAPPVNPDMATKVDYVYKFARNQITQDATTLKIYADDATTVDHKATVSDDGTVYTRGELATGP